MESLPSALVEQPSPGLSVPEAMRSLPELIEQAREASGAEHSARALRLNRHLEALASGGGSREVADVLLRLLESGQLEELEEKGGRTCRAVAVETLLRLGFPYALEVRPEDLEHLRQRGSPRRRRRVVPTALAAGSLGAGLVGEWWMLPHGFDTSSAALPLVTVMGLQLLALMAAVLGAERSDARRAGLWVLALLSALQVLLGVLGFSPALLVGGGAGLLAWLLLWLPRR